MAWLALALALWMLARCGLLGWRQARRLGVPAAVGVCLAVALSSYLATVLPALCGMLRPLPVLACLAACLLSAEWACRRSPVPRRRPAPRAPRGRARWALLALGLLACTPLFRLLFGLPAALMGRGEPLAWDGVMYHQPAAVALVQAGSLWTFTMDFASYHFGYELIANLPAVFLPSGWGIQLAHVGAWLFFLGALLLVYQQLRFLIPRAADRGLGGILLLGLVCTIFRRELLLIGKNDFLLSACILASLGLLLRSLAATPRARWFLLGAAAAAAGLALATKPNALGYLPFLLLLAGLPSGTVRARLGRMLTFATVAGALGGIFIVRNLVHFGSPVGEVPASAQQMTILGQLGNPALYQATLKHLAVLFGIAAFLPAGWLAWTQPAGLRRRRLLVVAFFLLVAFGVFCITPYTAIFADAYLIIRQGLIFLGLAAVFWTITALRCLPALESWLAGRRGARWLPAVCVVSLLAVAAVWHRAPPAGLPGFEDPPHIARTGVYRWVQQRSQPTRIVARGLSRYGLSGHRWQHRVWSLRAEDPQSVLRALAERRAELLLCCSWWNAGNVQPRSQLADWVAQQAFAREVYRDDRVRGFALDLQHPAFAAACSALGVELAD